MTMPIPVICDRCRAEGDAGEAQFADFGDLLDFEPVPRKIRRVDGWTADRQRAFIAASPVTGSPRQAARAVGKAQWGVDRLRKAKGAEGFSAAWDRAMAMAAGERPPPPRRRHRRGDRGGRGGAWPRRRRRRTPGRGGARPGRTRRFWSIVEILFGKYLLQARGQERRARLEGRIAEADFYVRQITCLEVSLDMVSGDGMKIMREFRCGGHDLLHIAETEMSRLLDDCPPPALGAGGDPPRPNIRRGTCWSSMKSFSTEPLEYTHGGVALSHKEQLGVLPSGTPRTRRRRWNGKPRPAEIMSAGAKAPPAHGRRAGPACPERCRRGRPACAARRQD